MAVIGAPQCTPSLYGNRCFTSQVQSRYPRLAELTPLTSSSQTGRPITRRITHLARQDESRHVAFGMAHLEHQATLDPGLRSRLRAAIERRHDALIETVGLNQEVFDALVVLAAGEWTPHAIRRGYEAITRLQADMDEGRQRRLVRLGFPPDEAAALSALHTRNFM